MQELNFHQKEEIGLVWVLDQLHPASACGRERLRAAKPAGPAQRRELERELEDVQRLVQADGEQRRLMAQMVHIFSQVRDVRPTLARCREVSLGDVELFEIKSLLLQLARLAPLSAELERQLGVHDAAIEACAPALALLDAEGRGTAAFYISSLYSEALAQARREKRSIEEQIRRAGADDELSAQRAAAAAREQNEEAVVCRRLSLQLRPYLDSMEQSLGRIARLDVLFEKARVARALGAVCPRLGGDVLRFQGLVNPYAADAVEKAGGTYTPVDIAMPRGATVITGANMGGKSVALRGVVLNTLLAHMGFFVFARQADIPLFDEILLIGEDRQSVSEGLSSFGAELAALSGALEASRGRFCLLVLDEFARGTNPEEGRRIVRALVGYLQAREGIALLATHYDGAAERAGAHYQVAGLREQDSERLKAELRAQPGGFEALRRYMDYRLFPARAGDECPRSALAVCRMLLAQQDLMRAIEESY